MFKKLLFILGIVAICSFNVLAEKIEEVAENIEYENQGEEENILYISDLEINGTVEIPSEVFDEIMELKKGEIFSSKKMVSDYIKLKDMKYITDIKLYPRIENGKIKLVLDVIEKDNVKKLLKEKNIVPISEREKIDKSLIIKSIEIEGNQYIDIEKIKEQIPINIGSYLSKEKILEGKKNIMKMGYFKDVRPDVLKYKSGIYLKYTVLENPILNSIEIIGNKVIEGKELLAVMKTKIGKIYNVNELRKDTERIRKVYSKKGYVMADIYDIKIDNDLNLKIEISEGILRGIEYKKVDKNDSISDGTRNGNDLKTRKYILDREINMEIGKVFEVNSYQRTLKNVFRTSHFKDVKPTFKRIPEDPDGLILVLNLDENKSAALQGAISYGDSDTGLIGSISVNDTNFRGKSQTLGVSGEISSEDQKSFSLNFSDPWIKGTDRLSVSTSIYRKDYEYENSGLIDEYEIITGAKLTLGKGIKRNWRFAMTHRLESIKEGVIVEEERVYSTTYTEDDGIWHEKITEELRDNDSDTEDILIDTIQDPKIVEKPEKTDEIVEVLEEKTYRKEQLRYSIFNLSPSLRYDTRNHRFDTTDGSYAELTWTPGYQFNGAGEDYREGFYSALKLEVRKFHKFLFKKNTLAYRGVLAGVSSGAIRSDSYYKVGGMYSLRGFESKDTEGSKQIYVNVENRYKIDDSAQFVLFYDIGSAYTEMDELTRLENLKSNYGVGLRLNTPLGPLRFDLAWPIDDSENKGNNFIFSIGQLF